MAAIALGDPASGRLGCPSASIVPANWTTSGLDLIGITFAYQMFTIEDSAAGPAAAASASSMRAAPAVMAQRRDDVAALRERGLGIWRPEPSIRRLAAC